jgi:hypothetical protein
LNIRVEKQQKDKPRKTREGTLAGETLQITMQGSVNLIITPAMLFMDEETSHKPLKDVKTLELALPNIPTKALYKLQVSTT